MAIRTYSTEGPGGVASLTPPGSNFVNSYVLAANTALPVTWPSDAFSCNIAPAVPGTTYYVKFGGTNTVAVTAIVPVGNTDGTGSAANVAQRRRASNEVGFSIISPTAQTVTVEFWGSATGQ